MAPPTGALPQFGLALFQLHPLTGRIQRPSWEDFADKVPRAVVFGELPKNSGSIYLEDKQVSISRPDDAINKGIVKTDKLITHVMPLEDFGKGLELAAKGGPGVIKILVKP